MMRLYYSKGVNYAALCDKRYGTLMIIRNGIDSITNKALAFLSRTVGHTTCRLNEYIVSENVIKIETLLDGITSKQIVRYCTNHRYTRDSGYRDR